MAMVATLLLQLRQTGNDNLMPATIMPWTERKKATQSLLGKRATVFRALLLKGKKKPGPGPRWIGLTQLQRSLMQLEALTSASDISSTINRF
ncbi:hypothetical protein MRB53_016633 [Persea americana]|uniref:Uncharacterized protein n=1 Tax=Persea americana TaxID=3435 RepID=A0ACC2M2J9_PERAE|nr:hypothetical protein MRB53_016633 [Persea americana]